MTFTYNCWALLTVIGFNPQRCGGKQGCLLSIWMVKLYLIIRKGLTVDNVFRVHAHYTLNTSFADFEKRAGAL